MQYHKGNVPLRCVLLLRDMKLFWTLFLAFFPMFEELWMALWPSCGCSWLKDRKYSSIEKRMTMCHWDALYFWEDWECYSSELNFHSTGHLLLLKLVCCHLERTVIVLDFDLGFFLSCKKCEWYFGFLWKKMCHGGLIYWKILTYLSRQYCFSYAVLILHKWNVHAVNHFTATSIYLFGLIISGSLIWSGVYFWIITSLIKEKGIQNLN